MQLFDSGCSFASLHCSCVLWPLCVGVRKDGGKGNMKTMPITAWQERLLLQEGGMDFATWFGGVDGPMPSVLMRGVVASIQKKLTEIAIDCIGSRKDVAAQTHGKISIHLPVSALVEITPENEPTAESMSNVRPTILQHEAGKTEFAYWGRVLDPQQARWVGAHGMVPIDLHIDGKDSCNWRLWLDGRNNMNPLRSDCCTAFMINPQKPIKEIVEQPKAKAPKKKGFALRQAPPKKKDAEPASHVFGQVAFKFTLGGINWVAMLPRLLSKDDPTLMFATFPFMLVRQRETWADKKPETREKQLKARACFASTYTSDQLNNTFLQMVVAQTSA